MTCARVRLTSAAKSELGTVPTDGCSTHLVLLLDLLNDGATKAHLPIGTCPARIDRGSEHNNLVDYQGSLHSSITSLNLNPIGQLPYALGKYSRGGHFYSFLCFSR